MKHLYRELSVTRNGILIAGRAIIGAKDASRRLRALLEAETPKSWATGWERVGFRKWISPGGALRMETFAPTKKDVTP